MIDKAKISKRLILDTSRFSEEMIHHKAEHNVNKHTGDVFKTDYFIYKMYGGITVIYSNLTEKLTIKGRLINANFVNNKVFNYDDYFCRKYKTTSYESEVEEIILSDLELCEMSTYDMDDNIVLQPRIQYIEYIEEIEESMDMEETIDSFNLELNELLNIDNAYLDIRDFKVDNIEISFNIWLEEIPAGKYIKLFNHIFQTRGDKRYKNFIFEEELDENTSYDESTSYYVKTASSYRDNLKDNYNINFYDKNNQLRSSRVKHKTSKEDLLLSEGLLRLEVQLYSKSLRRIYNEHRLEGLFIDFLNIDLCMEILTYYYENFISDSNLDFFNYEEAKHIISNTSLLNNQEIKNLLNHIREVYQYKKNHNNATKRKYKTLINKLGISEFFIPTSFNIPYMEGPMKLLDEKITKSKKAHKSMGYLKHSEYQQRFY